MTEAVNNEACLRNAHITHRESTLIPNGWETF